MKKYFYTLVFLGLMGLGGSTFLHAQPYQTSLGVRVGSGNGLVLKHFANEWLSVEGMFLYRSGGLRGVGLLTASLPLDRYDQFRIYGGVGGHFGYNRLFDETKDYHRVYGVDVSMGFEYVFDNAPLALALEYKPAVELAGQRPAFLGNNVGVILRVILR